MASTYAPPTRRFSARAAALPATNTTQVILLLVATAVFFVSALAILLPQTPIFVRKLAAPSAVPLAPAQLSPDQLEHVLSYARVMQPDDELVQVRPACSPSAATCTGSLLTAAPTSTTSPPTNHSAPSAPAPSPNPKSPS